MANLLLRAEVRDLRLEASLFERLVEGTKKLVELKGFGDVVGRSPLHHVDGILDASVPGNHDGDDAGIPFACGLDDTCAIDTR
jgi:hypothetical protein